MPPINLGDIQKFYFKIRIHPEQKKLCTFFAKYDEVTNSFRMGDPQCPWRTLQMGSLIMGLKQSPCISKACILKLAEEIRSQDPKTADTLVHMSYFDDLSPGITYEEAKAAFQADGEDGPLNKLINRTQVINKHLCQYNLQIKQWMSPQAPNMHELVTGEARPEVKICSTLGMAWDLRTDTWGYDKTDAINIGPNRRGVKKATFDLKDHHEVESYLKEKGLTKRMYLGISKSLFDPQGLLIPITQAFNMLFRQILEQHPAHWKWDQYLDNRFIPPFCQLIESLFYAKEHIRINRNLCPPLNATNITTTVIHVFDGSMVGGSIGLSYIHHEYTLDQGNEVHVDCHLALGRGRLNELRFKHQVQSELGGLRIGIRNDQDITRFIKLTTHRHIFVSDSQTVVRMTLKSSLSFCQLASIIIDKCQLHCNPQTDLYYLEGRLMDSLADKGTKFCLTPHLQLDEDYFKGGVFNQRAKDWPIQPASEFMTDQILDLPLLNLDIQFIQDKGIATTEEGGLLGSVHQTRSQLMALADKKPTKIPPFWKFIAKYRWLCTAMHYLISLCRVLARRLPDKFKPIVHKSRGDVYEWLMAHLLQQERHVTKQTVQYVMNNSRDYVVRDIGGVYFIKGRRGQEPAQGFVARFARLEQVTGHYFTPLLSRESHLAKAIARQTHDRCHSASIAFTARVIRTKWFINRIGPYLRKIKKGCFACRKLDQNLLQPEIGQLPLFRAIGENPGFSISVDMIGPYFIHKAGPRTRGSRPSKMWLLIAANNYNRQMFAIGLDSQSLEDLILAFSELFVHTGKPRRIVADSGSNFQALATTAKQLVPLLRENPTNDKPAKGRGKRALGEVHEEVIEESLAEEKVLALQKRLERTMQIDFVVSPPKAAWYNGFIESLIAEWKRLFKQVVPRSPGMTANALRALASICCGELNSRPIGLLPLESSEHTETLFSTPNSLNPTHGEIYPAGMGCASDLLGIDQLTMSEKIELQKRRANMFKRLHKTVYMEKYRKLWGKLPSPDRLQSGDVVFLPDKTKQGAYPTLGRVSQIAGTSAHILYCTEGGRKREVIRHVGSTVLAVRPDETDYINVELYHIGGQLNMSSSAGED